MFWTSLSRHLDIGDVEFHLVNKDVSESDMIKVLAIMSPGVKYKVHNLPFIGGSYGDIKYDDVAYTCDYMVMSCGSAEWLCISHFDIFFKWDWLTRAKMMIKSKVAMIGHHCPIMLLRREAYKDSKTKFGTDANHDTGQIMEKELKDAGWEVEDFENFNNEGSTHYWFHHIGGGGCHYEQSDIAHKISVVNQLTKPKQQPNGNELMTRRIAGIHLTFQSGTQWGIACMHGVDSAVIKGVVGHHQGMQMTGDPRAVTCNMCKKSAAYTEVKAKMGV